LSDFIPHIASAAMKIWLSLSELAWVTVTVPAFNGMLINQIPLGRSHFSGIAA
jgi:hypothetical protein